MITFLNTAEPETLWMMVSLLLLLLEFIYNKFVLVFFGLSAFVTSIITCLFVPVLQYQLLVFFLLILLSIMFIRESVILHFNRGARLYRPSIPPHRQKFLTTVAASNVKKNDMIEIKYDGRTMLAFSKDKIFKGDLVKIVKFDEEDIEIELYERDNT